MKTLTLPLAIFMASTSFNAQVINYGPRVPSLSSIYESIGALTVIDKENCYASDDQYCAIKSLETEKNNGGKISNYLILNGFDFNIPFNTTIWGIEVNMERKADLDDDRLDRRSKVIDYEVKLVKNGMIGGANRAKKAKWSASEEVVTYGNQWDMWEERWTGHDVSTDEFGVAIAVKISCCDREGNNALSRDEQGIALIDNVTVKIYTDKVHVVNPKANYAVESSRLKNESPLIYQVYPNPSKDGLVNISSEKEIKKLQLFDLNGKLIHSSYNSLNNYTLTIQNKGLYVLKIIDENELVYIDKLIIN